MRFLAFALLGLGWHIDVHAQAAAYWIPCAGCNQVTLDNYAPLVLAQSYVVFNPLNDAAVKLERQHVFDCGEPNAVRPAGSRAFEFKAQPALPSTQAGCTGQWLNVPVPLTSEEVTLVGQLGAEYRSNGNTFSKGLGEVPVGVLTLPDPGQVGTVSPGRFTAYDVANSAQIRAEVNQAAMAYFRQETGQMLIDAISELFGATIYGTTVTFNMTIVFEDGSKVLIVKQLEAPYPVVEAAYDPNGVEVLVSDSLSQFGGMDRDFLLNDRADDWLENARRQGVRIVNISASSTRVSCTWDGTTLTRNRI